MPPECGARHYFGIKSPRPGAGTPKPENGATIRFFGGFYTLPSLGSRIDISSRAFLMPERVREGMNGSAEPFGKLKALSLSRGSPKSPPYARILDSWPFVLV
jgi:hypothetical protein